MISIVVCYVDGQLAKKLHDNINDTIGVPFEIFMHDNRNIGWGLCKVYNFYAEKAKFDYLAFIHEDVYIHTLNWGEILIAKSSVRNVGVIGFAGGINMPSFNIGWRPAFFKDIRWNLIQHDPVLGVRRLSNNPESEDFSRVVAVDGMFMFLRKSIWIETPFDEINFRSFHYYDIDFSLSVHQRYDNYVCHLVDIEHLSMGGYTQSWYLQNRIFIKKWKNKLPIGFEDFSFFQKQRGNFNNLNVLIFRRDRKPYVKYASLFVDAVRFNFLHLLVLAILHFILSMGYRKLIAFGRRIS